MKFPVFLLMFIMLAACVAAFSVTNDFSAAALNNSVYVQDNLTGNVSMTISGGTLNFNGNSTGDACSRATNANLSFTPAYHLNGSSNGYMEIKIRPFTGYSDVNAKFTIGFTNGIWGVGAEGLAVTAPDSSLRYTLLDLATGGAACGTIRPSLDGNQHIFKIIVERNGYDTIYTAYWDTNLWCQFTRVGAKPDLFPIALDHSCGSIQHNLQIDDLIYLSGDNITAQGAVATGLTCSQSSDCISGFCNFMKVCALKGFKAPCVLSTECISGLCAGGYCSNPSGFQLLDQAKNDFVGDDEATNNLISLVVSFLLMLAVVIAGASLLRMEGGAPFIMGAVVFYLAMFFFAAVGWLSGWIIFGLILITGLLVLFGVLLHRG